MAAKKKRRIRSPHAGVKIKSRELPSGNGTRWFARFRDPDTGRETDVTLDPLALPTAEARRLWALRKAKEIAKRAMELEAGAPRVQRKTVADAIAEYERDGNRRLRARTLVVYMYGIRKFAAWAKRGGLEHTAEITAPRLDDFRKTLISAKRVNIRRGGKRGEREESERDRSAYTVNIEIRSTRTMLNAWRVGGLVPQLSRDAIADAMKTLSTPRDHAAFLAPADLGRLLRATLRHDAACFAETRAEHHGAGRRRIGTTPRYVPIAPFTAFLVLTGCRRGEALGLRWSDVDLEALDSNGKRVGEIRLKAAATKTKIGRTIGLEVSPALRALLAAMKLQAGDAPHVFGGIEHYTGDLVESSRTRLLETFGAPSFDWQMLRSTCATYLTNAPGIFGAATVFLSARQLGHSVAVAEKHYLGVHRGIAREARTLEAAMQIQSELRDIVARATSPLNSSPASVATGPGPWSSHDEHERDASNAGP